MVCWVFEMIEEVDKFCLYNILYCFGGFVLMDVNIIEKEVIFYGI